MCNHSAEIWMPLTDSQRDSHLMRFKEMVMSNGGVWYSLRSNFLLPSYTEERGSIPRRCMTSAVAPFSKKNFPSVRTTDPTGSHLAQMPEGTSAGGVWCTLRINHNVFYSYMHERGSTPRRCVSCGVRFFLSINLFFPAIEQLNDAHLSRKERRQKSTGCGVPFEIIKRCVLYFTEERVRLPAFRCCFFFIRIKFVFFHRLSFLRVCSFITV